MPDSSSPRRPRRLIETLLVVALLAGGAFFWANKNHSSRDEMSPSEAFAAPRQSRSRPPGAMPRSGAMAPPVHWVPASRAQRADAIKTIGGQLHAFDIGDWKGAVVFQSQGMKSSFSSPEMFGQMIQRGFPAFVRARHVDFGEAKVSGPMLQMLVRLTPRAGTPVVAQYRLIKEGSAYRISGVIGGTSAPSSNGRRNNSEDGSGGGLIV